MNLDQAGILKVLRDYKKICVVGFSPDPSKPSHSVPLYMREHGYEIAGVNPAGGETSGVKLYKQLSEVPSEFRRFINVFRRPDAIPGVVEEVLAAGGAEVLWLQLGISHPEAEKRAEAAGLQVVSNRCLYIEHRKI